MLATQQPRLRHAGLAARRRRAAILALGGAIVLALFVMPAAASAQPGGAAKPEREFDTSDAGVAHAKKQFARIVNTYRSAAAIRDNAVIETISRFGGQEQRREVTIPILLTPDAASLEFEKLTLTAVDGTVYAEWEDRPDRYFALDYQGPISGDLFVHSMPIFPLVEVPLMYESDPVMRMFNFTLDPKIAGFRTVETSMSDGAGGVGGGDGGGGGGALHEEILVESSGDGAPFTLRYDPKRMLLSRFESTLHDPQTPPGDGLTVIVEMYPEILDEAPLEELLVETTDRELAASMMELTAPPNTSDLVGKPAPDFSLQRLSDGAEVILDDLLGDAIVISFWSIPSEGLTPVLDAVQKVHNAAIEQGRSVKTVTVNLYDPEDELKQVLSDRAITLEVFRDSDQGVIEDYMLPYFPVTVVIAPDGKINRAFVGVDPTKDFHEELQKAVDAALEVEL